MRKQGDWLHVDAMCLPLWLLITQMPCFAPSRHNTDHPICASRCPVYITRHRRALLHYNSISCGAPVCRSRQSCPCCTRRRCSPPPCGRAAQTGCPAGAIRWTVSGILMCPSCTRRQCSPPPCGRAAQSGCPAGAIRWTVRGNQCVHAAATASCFCCRPGQPSLVTPRSVAACVMRGCRSKLCAPNPQRTACTPKCRSRHCKPICVKQPITVRFRTATPAVRPAVRQQPATSSACLPHTLKACLITLRSMPAAHTARQLVGAPAARPPAAGRQRTRCGTSRARRAALQRPARACCRRGASCARRAGTAPRAPAPPAAPAAPAPKPNPDRVYMQAPLASSQNNYQPAWDQRRRLRQQRLQQI